MYPEQIFMLIIYGLVPYFARMFIGKQLDITIDSISSNIQQLNPWVKCLVAAIPEQTVLYLYEEKLPLIDRLLVSVAMVVINFGWNGMNGSSAPRKAYNELVWILGTALYAYQVIRVRLLTATMLILSDSVFTLLLRGVASRF